MDALVGPATRVEDPDGAAIVAQALERAGRLGMYDAIRWLSLSRPDLAPVLDQLGTPTLLITGQHDPMWTVPAARAAAAHLRHGTMTVLPGAGHIGPVLDRTPAAADLITAFWREPDATIAARRATIAATSG